MRVIQLFFHNTIQANLTRPSNDMNYQIDKPKDRPTRPTDRQTDRQTDQTKPNQTKPNQTKLERQTYRHTDRQMYSLALSGSTLSDAETAQVQIVRYGTDSRQVCNTWCEQKFASAMFAVSYIYSARLEQCGSEQQIFIIMQARVFKTAKDLSFYPFAFWHY